MGKKKKKQEQEIIFCYYCDRLFGDEVNLVTHQKNKHFKCPECNRKMNTAQGLSTHCYQVHKLTITAVPAAKPGRESIDIEIFGMAGIPDEFEREVKDGEPGSKRAKLGDDDDDEQPAAPLPPAPQQQQQQPMYSQFAPMMGGGMIGGGQQFGGQPMMGGMMMPPPGQYAQQQYGGYGTGPMGYGGPPQHNQQQHQHFNGMQGMPPQYGMSGPPGAAQQQQQQPPYPGGPPGMLPPGMPPPGMMMMRPPGMPPQMGILFPGAPPGMMMPPPSMGPPQHQSGNGQMQMPMPPPGSSLGMNPSAVAPPLFPIGAGPPLPGAGVPPQPSAQRPLFPIADSKSLQQPQLPLSNGSGVQPPQPLVLPDASVVLWSDETYSMEERRAMLPKYSPGPKLLNGSAPQVY